MRRRLLSLLFLVSLTSAAFAQFAPAPQSGVKLRSRSIAEFESEQKTLLSNYCRLDFDGARLDPSGWTRLKPYTSLRANPEFVRIVVVTRFNIEIPQQPGEQLAATYRTVGFYQRGEGYRDAVQSDRVQFRVQEQNGILLVTGFTPDEPHVSPHAAVTWMNLLLDDSKTPDWERANLKSALQRLNKFLPQPRSATP